MAPVTRPAPSATATGHAPLQNRSLQQRPSPNPMSQPRITVMPAPARTGFGPAWQPPSRLVCDVPGAARSGASSSGRERRFPPHPLRTGMKGIDRQVVQVTSCANADQTMKEFLKQVSVEVVSAYEAELDFQVATNRPANWRRSLTHAMSSVLVVSLCHLVLQQQLERLMAACFVASLTWIWEIGRRRSPTFDSGMKKAFESVGMSQIFHKEEWSKVTSWTWYVTALVVLCYLPSLPAAFAGLLVLGFGDPVAASVGRRWGTTRVPGAGRKTVEGALAFLLVGFCASLAGLMLTHGAQLGLKGAAIVSLAAAVGGCLGELYNTRISRSLDDNFTVPVLGGLSALGIAKVACI
mmetsp:Transcript_5887/g.16500  ORF Transcript_5887/g.16500 Transcript_5887/m.16500 type:complete len:352 (+) Transcript_5887:222-1277(+)|eukprot:CAMPEP_0117664832 /NCGR_PEP_ID=MMETSP0804-20121206/9454_1 /TAXON_ID=1074897 /ORGANISM="Tetraselmis astigmatica, Strain CCMP880" /LENGTH=351 /DNA_ID=CAMNT_0005472139 /DNA_START=402 /DNA_END=1457 /DNA_ORIENTATION=-